MWSLCVALICMVTLMFVGYLYINDVDKKARARTEAALVENNRKWEQAIQLSNQKWCGIVILFDTAYRQTPPTSPTGQTLANYFAQLREDFKC